ncbi:PPE family protein [Mycobacterium helveticum]|uniref:PPE family protein n=1 Tax=Mycobacterium helveticum TaxID=2592811 RepID=A0A557XRY2_9MYCO|nr:PPE family protein [Mycobacterium helveticum]TVS85329.1 PPE family protein [Mycobacterium helveticum]TVS88683.1 PPE family protein [Mycobacterium helveticum]
MFDFGALPPEINSARMYSGPGSAPMMAAASAWDALATQLESYAAGYASTLSELQGLWAGGASFAMAGALAPYVAWASATAAQAEQTAGRARAAAAAYEAAFAATVPPGVVAANRIQLAVLVATNFFGQNAPAIAATEAQYAEMWAQDAATMYGYAASSSTATALTPFSQPPQTTTPAGAGEQAAAVTQATGTSAGESQVTVSELMSALPQQLQALATGASTNTSAANPAALFGSTPLLTAFTYFDTFVAYPGQIFWNTPYTIFSAGVFRNGVILRDDQLAKIAARAEAKAAAAAARGPVAAQAGEAAAVGKLSVPQGWVTANPTDGSAVRPIALSDNGFRAVPAAAAQQPSNMVGGLPAGKSEPESSVVLRNGRRRFTMPRPPYGG